MKLMHSGIHDFANETANCGIILFGANRNNIEILFDQYRELKIWERVIAIADNDTSKHGTLFTTVNGSFYVIPAQQLPEIYSNDTSVSILITVIPGHVIDVYKQLDSFEQLKDTTCYVFEMFPFYDKFGRLPDKVHQVRRDAQQIPKLLHYIWIGDKPLSAADTLRIENWKKMCPDYELKLWNDTNYDFRKNRYMREAYDNGQWAYATDYARLDIIYENGGIYLDTDAEMHKNLSELLYHDSFFGLAGFEKIATGLCFGAGKHNLLVKELRDDYENVSFVLKDGKFNEYSCTDIQARIFKDHGLRAKNDFYVLDDSCVIFPAGYFASSQVWFGAFPQTENTFTTHYYRMSTHLTMGMNGIHMNMDQYAKKMESRVFWADRI